MNAASVSPLSASAPATLPRCRCGNDRHSRESSPEREYSLGGAAYLLWGGTSIPRRVNFRCVRCQRVFDSVTAREACRKYVC
jgi:hypothetical protein